MEVTTFLSATGLGKPNPSMKRIADYTKNMKTKKKKNNLSKAEHEAAALFGRMGGKANAKSAGKNGMSERGKKGAAARWGKKAPKKGSQ